MVKTIRAKWVKALRSGKYKQGRGRLRRFDDFCCLGVLCDLYLKETGLGRWVHDGSISTFITNTDGEVGTRLPPSVIEWAGMSSLHGNFYNGRRTSSLTEENDSGKSFEEIADIIAKPGVVE